MITGSETDLAELCSSDSLEFAEQADKISAVRSCGSLIDFQFKRLVVLVGLYSYMKIRFHSSMFYKVLKYINQSLIWNTSVFWPHSQRNLANGAIADYHIFLKKTIHLLHFFINPLNKG
jgi:hypothetical protein